MSDYVFIMCNCIACGVPVFVNPEHVPSIRINGVREAICRACFNEWNKVQRTDKGLEPIPLHPRAYQAERES